MNNHRFIIADDHPLFRDALNQALNTLFDGAVITEAASFSAVTRALEDNGDVDLILFDLKMPGVQGFSGLVHLRAQYPAVPVVVVSAQESAPVIRRAMSLGASGFIPKSTQIEEIRSAVEAVLGGEIWCPPGIAANDPEDGEVADIARRLATLTPQQMRVMMMLREGLLNKQIAYELSVSEATVKAHVSAILQKLCVDSRTQAVIITGKLDSTADMPASML